MKRIFRVVLIVTGAAALAMSAAATAPAKKPPTQPTTPTVTNYVALGDSYSAGNGANSSNLSSSCNRNTYAYPYLVAQQNSYALTFVACSGAQTGDVNSSQVGALSSTTNLVTITIGGNDVGFANLIIACTTLGCDSQIRSSNSQIANQLPGKLDTTYSLIKSKASNAKVIVLGYPRPFAHRTCTAAAGVTLSEEDQLNALTDNLNNVIKTKAKAYGFTYADPNPYWSGHDVCSSTPFTNGTVFFPATDSYHPTRSGYSAGYTPLVRSITG